MRKKSFEVNVFWIAAEANLDGVLAHRSQVSITRSCLVLLSGTPRTARTGGDLDTAACCPLPDYARHGMPLTLTSVHASKVARFYQTV
jgi:hypothetical protein